MDRSESLKTVIRLIQENFNHENNTVTLGKDVTGFVLSELSFNLDQLVGDEIKEYDNVIQVDRETFIRGV